MNSNVKWVSLVLLGAMLVACTPTTVQFTKPTGTKMELNGSHTWPCRLELTRPDKVGEVEVYQVTLQLPSDEGLVKVVGTLRLFAYEPPAAEKVADYVVELTGDQLKDLYAGKTVTLEQKDNGNRMYELTLGQGSTKAQN